jgi:hypothetical protein
MAKQGTGFVNWERYLNANKSTADDMAKRVVGAVGNKGLATEAATENALGGFRGAVAAGNPALSQVARSTGAAMQGAAFGSMPTASGVVASGAGAIGGVVGERGPGANARAYSDSALSGWLGEMNRRASEGYAGPSGLGQDQVDALNAQAEAYQRAVGLSGTHGGRTALVQDAYGGGNGFDAALMGASAGNDFDALRTRYAGLADTIEGARKRAEEDAGVAKGQAEERAAVASATATDLQKELGRRRKVVAQKTSVKTNLPRALPAKGVR